MTAVVQTESVGTASGAHEHATDCIRVIGCGRRFRRDDQAGIIVAEAVAAMGLPRTRVELTEAPGAEAFEELRPHDLLVVVDAAQPAEGVPAGSFRRIDYIEAPARILAGCRTNTHMLGVDAALELGRALGLLPAIVWVYVVAGEDFGYGQALSGCVARSIPRLAEQIRADIEQWLHSKGGTRA